MNKQVLSCLSVLTLSFAPGSAAFGQAAPISEQTQMCLTCHEATNPGLVADWRASRHARTTPADALQKPALERRVSSEAVPENLRPWAVGCHECHALNAASHKDNFDHLGTPINVVVSPDDCRTCHADEAEQYAGSKKAHALENLRQNPVFELLVNTTVSVKNVKDARITRLPATQHARGETCYACHGTEVTVNGTKQVTSDLGEIDVPDLRNWPNQGVGRVNPDGSHGACTACHPRHSFAIEIARKPHTCAQCHIEPDVPAYNVYAESKHGNIYDARKQEWTWDAVPWKVGADFQAPTCATCHNSLVVTPGGDEIVARTHDFGARLWVRIFGLIYSHRQPKDGRTSLIRNADGLPLPTTFTGEPAAGHLIAAEEQLQRRTEMRRVCQACHGTSWANGHFSKLDETLVETDKMTLAATRLMLRGWDLGLADRENPFDEELEQLWLRQWLFYANSVRYASAMGGPDYASFKNGWWELTANLQEMHEFPQLRQEKSR